MAHVFYVFLFIDLSKKLLELCGDEDHTPVLLSWMYTHPHAYRSMIASININCDAYSRRKKVGIFFSYVPRLVRGHYSNKSVLFTIRAERNGICRNDSCSCVSVETALHSAILISLLFPSQVHLTLICIDTLATKYLVSHPLFSRVDVNEIHSRGMTVFNALTSSILASGYSSVSTPHKPDHAAGSVVQHAEKLIVLSEGAQISSSLHAADKLPSLQHLILKGIPIRSLHGVTSLTQLNVIDVSSTLIGDRDIIILSSLPQLTSILMDDCKNVTTINDISDGVAPLKNLCAARCPRLFHYSSLGRIRRLEYLDISYATGHSMFMLLSSKPLSSSLSVVVMNYCRFPSERPSTHISEDNFLHRVVELSLIGATIIHMEWLLFASNVRVIQLDRTCITDKDLIVLSKGWLNLVTVSLCDCKALHTDVEWASSLPILLELHISRSSLVNPSNAYRFLRDALVVH